MPDAPRIIEKTPFSVKKMDAPSSGPSQGESAPRSGARNGPDKSAFLALAREIGKCLSAFKPPDWFQVEPPSAPKPLTPAIAQSLGAASLEEFFGRVQAPGSPGSAGGADAVEAVEYGDLGGSIRSNRKDYAGFGEKAVSPLPKGLDDVRAALSAVDEAIAECEEIAKVDPARQARRRAELNTSLTALLRAEQLGEQFKIMAEKWPETARLVFQEASELHKATNKLLASIDQARPEPAFSGTASFTALSFNLSERLMRLKKVFAGRLAWQSSVRTLSDEIDEFANQAWRDEADGGRSDAFWLSTARKNRQALAQLESEHQELGAELDRRSEAVQSALRFLEEAESRNNGEIGADFVDRAERMASSVEASIAAAMTAAAELKECWVFLPTVMGRPAFLDKIFLSAASHLGNALSLGEESRAALSRFTGRMSSTCEIRGKARRALSLPDRSREYRNLLTRAKRSLDVLDKLNLLKVEGEKLAAEAERQRLRADKLEAVAHSREALILEYQNRAEVMTARADDLAAEQNRSQSDLERLKQDGEALSQALEGRNQEISRLRQRLSAASLTESADARLRENLSSVEAERDSLEEQLAQAKDRLNSLGQFKIRVLKSVDKAKAVLAKAADDKAGLEKIRRELEEELSDLRRRQAKLTDYYARDRQALQSLESRYEVLASKYEASRRETANYLDERARLTTAIGEKELELAELSKKSESLSTSLADRQKRISDLNQSVAALNLELSAGQERLSQVSQARERMAEVISALRLRSERLLLAHNALRKSWSRRGVLLAAGEAENEALRLKLDKQKRNLISLVTRKQKLLAELAAHRQRIEGFEQERQHLLAQVEEAKRQGDERLSEELKKLQDEIDNDLKPLVQVLSMALWRGQAHLKTVHDSVNKKLDEQRRIFQAREADVRVASAAREIDYMELLSVRDEQLKAAKAEKDSAAEEIEAMRQGSAEKDEDLVKRSWVCQQLSMALSSTTLRTEKLKRSLVDFRQRLVKQKTESESIKTELEELVRNQAKALCDHRAWLDELVPLVGFFLQSGRELWAGSGKEDARDAVLQFMNRENAELAEELKELKSERQELSAERLNYLGLNDSLRSRLMELQPLVEFLVANFVQTTAALAQVSLERQELLARLNLLARSGPGAAPPSQDGARALQSLDALSSPEVEIISSGQDSQAPMSAEILRIRKEVERLNAENARLSYSLAQVEASREKARGEIVRLEAEKTALASSMQSSAQELSDVKNQAESLGQEKKELQELLQNQEMSISLARTEAGRLTLERDHLKAEVSAKNLELSGLQARLSELQNAESSQDWRLEAAWAAINYINSKAGDAMGNLQVRLDKQAWDLENAFQQMKSRDEEIKILCERQDKLSLLWWTIFSLASEGQYLSASEADAESRLEADALAEADLGEEETIKLIGVQPGFVPSLGRLREGTAGHVLTGGSRSAASPGLSAEPSSSRPVGPSSSSSRPAQLIEAETGLEGLFAGQDERRRLDNLDVSLHLEAEANLEGFEALGPMSESADLYAEELGLSSLSTDGLQELPPDSLLPDESPADGAARTIWTNQTNQSNQTGQTNQTNQPNQSNQTSHSNQTTQSNQAGQANQTNQINQTSQTSQSNQSNQSNQSSQSSQTNQTSQTGQTNWTNHSNQPSQTGWTKVPAAFGPPAARADEAAPARRVIAQSSSDLGDWTEFQAQAESLEPIDVFAGLENDLAAAEDGPRLGVSGDAGEVDPASGSPVGAAAGAAAGPAEAPVEERKNEEGSLGGSVLKELRKVARRSLFSLFLAGLVVMPTRMSQASSSPLLLGGPESPIVYDGPDPWLAPMVQKPVNRLSSNYLLRTMDLGILSGLDRSPLAAEKAARERVAALAARLGMPEESMLNLVRRTYPKEAVVNLTDLESDRAPVTLLRPHLPKLSMAIKRSNRLLELSSMVLPVVEKLEGSEWQFWERLFDRFNLKLQNEGEAAEAVSWRLHLRDAHRLSFEVVFGGEKAPIGALEKLNADQAVDFITDYVANCFGRALPETGHKKTGFWRNVRKAKTVASKAKGKRLRTIPKGSEPYRLASDLVHVARIFELPRTLALITLQNDFHVSGFWPGTLEMYAYGGRLASMLHLNSFAFEQGKRLCDFDVMFDDLRDKGACPHLTACYVKLREQINEKFHPGSRRLLEAAG
ncbi:MAG: hypothetical protein LBJ64_03010 [Deltaproteobacteria bacterium]|jgi:chromosome segregation ATPase|nr:hypothetical protein [Deltaproteobacteria bacterium]